MKMIPNGKVRLTQFLKSHLGPASPTFWEGKVLIPFGTFDILLHETEEEVWRWKGTVLYHDDVVFETRSNSLNPVFFDDLLEGSRVAASNFFDHWMKKIDEEIEPYLAQEHGIRLEEDEEAYEGYDPESSFFGERVHKRVWVMPSESSDSELDIEVESSIQILLSDKNEPCIITDSKLLNSRTIYSVHLDDDTGWKKVLSEFLSELEAHNFK